LVLVSIGRRTRLLGIQHQRAGGMRSSASDDFKSGTSQWMARSEIQILRIPTSRLNVRWRAAPRRAPANTDAHNSADPPLRRCPKRIKETKPTTPFGNAVSFAGRTCCGECQKPYNVKPYGRSALSRLPVAGWYAVAGRGAQRAATAAAAGYDGGGGSGGGGGSSGGSGGSGAAAAAAPAAGAASAGPVVSKHQSGTTLPVWTARQPRRER